MTTASGEERTVLAALPPERAERVLTHAERVRLARGQVLFEEGAEGRDLYLVRTGELEVFRRHNGQEHRIAVVLPGQTVGELAFFDPAPRSASVRATADTELLAISADRVRTDPDGEALVNALSTGIASQTIERLRQATDAEVAALEAQLRASRLQTQFGQFFGYVMASFGVGTIVNAVLTSGLVDVDIHTRTFSWLYLVVLLVPALVAVWRMGVPLREIGVTTEGWRRSLGEGIGASIALAVVVTAGVWGLRSAGVLETPEGTRFPWSRAPLYFAHSFLQELLARGLIQSSFQRLFADQRGARSVFFSTVLFALVHVHFGLGAVALVGVSSILFGFFYLRHHNLVGVTVLHWSAGVVALRLGLL